MDATENVKHRHFQENSASILSKKKPAWEEESVDVANEDPCFAKLLASVKLTAAIFGMFFVQRNDRSRNKIVKLASERLKNMLQSTFLYNGVVCFLLTVNVIRHIIAFWIRNAQEDPTFRIISGLWLTMGTVNIFLMIKSTHPRFGNYKRLLLLLDEKIWKLFQEQGIVFPIQKIRKYVKKVLTVIWTLILITIISLAVVYFITVTPALKSMRMLFILPIPESAAVVVVSFSVQVLSSVAWGIPVPYCITMCLLLKHAFKQLNIHFVHIIRDEKTETVCSDKVAMYRSIHLKLCQCVAILDKDLHYFFANWYIINLPQTCFISFILLNRHLDSISIALLLFWLVTGLTLVVVTSGFAANLHEAVSTVIFLY